MRRQDYEDIINDLLHCRNALENGSITKDMTEVIEDRIIFLNAYIDAMEPKKTEEDYNIIGMAYNFYRLKEKYN